MEHSQNAAQIPTHRTLKTKLDPKYPSYIPSTAAMRKDLQSHSRGENVGIYMYTYLYFDFCNSFVFFRHKRQREKPVCSAHSVSASFLAGSKRGEAAGENRSDETEPNSVRRSLSLSHTHTHSHIHTYTRTLTRARAYTHTHWHTHAHTHTHTHDSRSWQSSHHASEQCKHAPRAAG